jgi:hypothetical protein
MTLDVLTLASSAMEIGAQVATAAVGALTFLGAYKFLIEPWWVAVRERQKYAIALWIACQELKLHLVDIQKILNDPPSRDRAMFIDSLLKLPKNDAGNRKDWFVKTGYNTTITAYKIALVAAWLRIYQRALLFAPYSGSRKVASELYERAQAVKLAFSENTCLWYDYFNAIGDQLVTESGDGERPLEFSAFCHRYCTDSEFLQFFDQLHLFIWQIAKYPSHSQFPGKSPGPFEPCLAKVIPSLESIITFLAEHKFLRNWEPKRPALQGTETVMDLNENPNGARNND